MYFSLGTFNFRKVESFKLSSTVKIGKEFLQLVNKKKRKLTTGEALMPKLKKGTTAYHIVKFIQDCMDILDKMNKKDVYFVMDKCKIHHSYFVVGVINNRCYKPLFMLLPPLFTIS
jgi:hypothetical protein